MEINGITPGTEHDQIVVGGTATLGGALNLYFGNGLVEGDSFTLIDAAAITGDFDQALEAVARAKQVAGPWIVAEARREDLRPWEEHLRSRVRRETDF